MANSKPERDFFERDSHEVARNLLGHNLVRVFEDGKKAVGKIVEVEVYQGFDDRASHASRNRTSRNEVMYGEAGHFYIYMIYGMYFCLNVVTEKKDFPAAILIRALEPISDNRATTHKSLRGTKQPLFEDLSEKEKINLANGPGKLCRWMEIDKKLNGESIENSQLFFEQSEKFSLRSNNNVVATKRIGVDYAGDSKHLEWRYFIKDNMFVSR